MAMALKTPFVPTDMRFAVTTGVGFYDGKQAFAMGAGLRLNTNVQLDGGLAVGFDQGEVGGRVGMTFAW